MLYYEEYNKRLWYVQRWVETKKGGQRQPMTMGKTTKRWVGAANKGHGQTKVERNIQSWVGTAHEGQDHTKLGRNSL